jgi:hypothetical protein
MSKLFRLPADEILDQMILHMSSAQWKEWPRFEHDLLRGCGFQSDQGVRPKEDVQTRIQTRIQQLVDKKEVEIQSKSNGIARIRLRID